MSNALSDLYMRGMVDRQGKLIRPSKKIRAGLILLISAVLVLCLVVTLYASPICTFLETKPDWGINGFIIIDLTPFSSPGDLGIRIDGSMLMLI